MDRLIQRFDSVKDGDLRICAHRGVAYQRDMTAAPVAYDDAYHDHYLSLEGTAVAEALNAGRCDMVTRHAEVGARVLDFGAGSGTFVRKARDRGMAAWGYDIMPKTVAHLKEIGAYSDEVGAADAVTFWDSLEHIDNPDLVLRNIRAGALVLVAIPVFEDLSRVRESKHYKPGEHLYYWTAQGFIDWMALHGFRLLETSDHETRAGRESIGAFAFRKDLPGYDEHIAAYQEMHATRFYGSSATELHLDTVAAVVRERNPRSILDFGCGRSDLVAHFWRDGARRIARYDPAIRQHRHLPDGTFDLVLCCDVMEHIPMGAVEQVFQQIKDKSRTALFTISTKLARAKLPDGRNAHVTLLTRAEWMRWVSDVFGMVQVLPGKHEHDLVLLAGASV